MICGHCGRRDADVDVEHVRACESVHSLADVERLLENPAPPIHLLLDGIAVTKRERRYDLCDRCIQFAIASVTGETPDGEIRNLAREAAQRQVAAATEQSLRSDLGRGVDSLRDLGRQNARVALHMDTEIELLDHIALSLKGDTARGMVAGAARLREMNRSDLAFSFASKAALINPHNAAPRVSMAAALLDLERADEGLAESMNGENLEPSEYTSSTISRAHRVLEHADQAIAWAEKTIQRDPDSPAGYRALAAAAFAARDGERLDHARRELKSRGFDGGRREWSQEYIEFLTGVEFLKSGKRERGLSILRPLAESGYRPAARKVLEYEMPGSRPSHGRSSRQRPST